MLQRIKKCFGIESDKLDNEVECDETYIGGRNKNRHTSKKVEDAQGRSLKDKAPVFGMIERGGKLIAKKVTDTKAETLTKEIVANIKNTAMIYTDEWLAYKSLHKMYSHSVVFHNSNEFVNGRAYTNTLEGFLSLLKRGIFGIYHFTSKKHLQMYIDEFVFRYNTRDLQTSNRFNVSYQI